MEKYNEYKDSGIEWLGVIPEHWGLDRIKNLGTVKARVGWKALKASEYVKSGYFFLSTPNIKKVNIDYKNVNYITRERYYESPEIMLQNGDILLVKDGSTLGIVNIVKNLKNKGTVNSSIGVLRLKKQVNKYFFYFLKSNYLQNIIGLKKEGMGVPHLFQKDINNFLLSIPPLKEQAQIANYLDAKTTAIDKKVKLLHQKIKHYKAYRKTLINETVTKGLDKTVKLKDSGINWIGEIPVHWEVDRMKKYFSIEKTKVGEFSKNYLLLSLTKKGIIPRDLEKNAGKFPAEFNTYQVVEPNDLVFCLFDLDVTPRTIGYSYHNGMITGAYTIIKSKKNIENKYYYYMYLSIDDSKNLSLFYTGLRNTIKKDTFISLPIPIPSKKEQKQIADFLDTKTATIDNIVKNIETQITTLKELRKTLINEVVTGKVKVSA